MSDDDENPTDAARSWHAAEARPEDPGDGRVWVWLQGENPPRWELKGTGLVDDQ